MKSCYTTKKVANRAESDICQLFSALKKVKLTDNAIGCSDPENFLAILISWMAIGLSPISVNSILHIFPSNFQLNFFHYCKQGWGRHLSTRLDRYPQIFADKFFRYWIKKFFLRVLDCWGTSFRNSEPFPVPFDNFSRISGKFF